MPDDLLAHLAFSNWCHCIKDLAFRAEARGPEPVTDSWVRSFRADINFGYTRVCKWVDSLNGQPWPPDAPMSRVKLASTIRVLYSDALHLVTVLQNADCWGVRYSDWKCAADRELVDRVRRDVADLNQLIEFLSALAIEAARNPNPSGVESAANIGTAEICGAVGTAEILKAIQTAEAVASALACGKFSIAKAEIAKERFRGPLIAVVNEHFQPEERFELFKHLLQLLGSAYKEPKIEYAQAIRDYCQRIRDYMGADVVSLEPNVPADPPVSPYAGLFAAIDLVSPDAGKAMQIAKDKTKNVKERMALLFDLDERFKGFSSEKLGELLDCSGAYVRKALAEIDKLADETLS